MSESFFAVGLGLVSFRLTVGSPCARFDFPRHLISQICMILTCMLLTLLRWHANDSQAPRNIGPAASDGTMIYTAEQDNVLASVAFPWTGLVAGGRGSAVRSDLLQIFKLYTMFQRRKLAEVEAVKTCQGLKQKSR